MPSAGRSTQPSLSRTAALVLLPAANAILVPTWLTDDADVELCALVDLLEQCAACDVRPVPARPAMEELMQAWQMSSLAEAKGWACKRAATRRRGGALVGGHHGAKRGR